MTLPPLYLRLIADSFDHCASVMSIVRPDGLLIDEWDTALSYFQTISSAIADDVDQRGPLEASELNDNIMDLLRYEELAELMHSDLVNILHNSATAVAEHCRFFLPLAPDDTQLACLQGLALGQNQAELAAQLGYSKRHLQRMLATLWDQFGVEGPAQGVAFAVTQGWVTIPAQNP